MSEPHEPDTPAADPDRLLESLAGRLRDEHDPESRTFHDLGSRVRAEFEAAVASVQPASIESARRKLQDSLERTEPYRPAARRRILPWFVAGAGSGAFALSMLLYIVGKPAPLDLGAKSGPAELRLPPTSVTVIDARPSRSAAALLEHLEGVDYRLISGPGGAIELRIESPAQVTDESWAKLMETGLEKPTNLGVPYVIQFKRDG